MVVLWFWRAFSGFLPKGPLKTPKKRHATGGFAPRDHGKQKRGQLCANGVILPHFHTFAAISPFFALNCVFGAPERKPLCSMTFLRCFGRPFWQETGKCPPGPLLNKKVSKMTNLSLKSGSGRHLRFFTQMALPKHLRNVMLQRGLRSGAPKAPF